MIVPDGSCACMHMAGFMLHLSFLVTIPRQSSVN